MTTTFPTGQRNAALDALIAFGARIAIPGAPTGVPLSARKFVLWDQLAPEQQPALIQTSPRESQSQRKGMPPIRLVAAVWTIYFRADQNAVAGTPAGDEADRTCNAILDAIEASLLNGDDPDGNQTLGGRVAHCWIDGEIIKIDGSTDGQGMIVIPITLQLP